jgi:hypothetical protein
MMGGSLMGNELERKRLRPNFKYYTEICLEGLTKATKILRVAGIPDNI